MTSLSELVIHGGGGRVRSKGKMFHDNMKCRIVQNDCNDCIWSICGDEEELKVVVLTTGR